MKYKLRGENDYLNPIKTVLENRNITEDLFYLTDEVIENYNNYNNIDKAINILLYHINNKNKIVIIVDSDVDGLTSSAILYNYIKEVFNYDNLYYQIHTGKQHGLSDDIIVEEDVNLIILPDASSNDYEQHKLYKNKGIDIIVLDHHLADHESEYAIIVNNQLSPNVKNKNISGVGVTYKFLKALDDYLFENKADYYIDLVALGNIADVISLAEKETRFLCYQGISNVNNLFLKVLIEKNEFQLENKYNIMKIGWVIAPKLNGTIRSGTQEIKENMFKAFISDDYEFCCNVADKCKSSKDTQDSAVKSALTKIEKDIQLTPIDRCLILEVSKTLNKNHTGLVAGKLQEKYGVPVLLYRQKEDIPNIVGGSGRGNSNITEDFKTDLSNSGLFEFVEGHEGAFGFEIKKDNIKTLKNYLNELYKDREVINGKTYEVDFILNEETLNNDIVTELCQYEDEWGNGIPEPLIAFENLTVFINENNIKGKRNLVFEVNGIKFIKKFITNVLRDTVLQNGLNIINCIGKCVNNIYDGNTYPQIELVDVEVL